MTQPFRENPKLAKSLHMANKILTGLVFIAYPCLLLWMLWHKDPRLTNAIIYPMNGFICVTVVRAILNFPRPYERFGIPPVIPKDTKGHSWPSRHVFSATIIALVFLPVNMPMGIALLVCAAGIAVIRVISGVHASVMLWQQLSVHCSFPDISFNCLPYPENSRSGTGAVSCRIFF